MTTASNDWGPGIGVEEQRPLAPGMSTNTWAIWVMALLPLLGIVTTLALNPGAETQRTITRSAQQIHEARSGHVVVTAVQLDGTLLLSYGLGLLLLAVQVFLAVADQRALRRLGIIRPMPWGWVFLNPVYIIGRHVVVRRRVHGSLAPLWVWIIATAIDLAFVITVYAFAVGDALSSASLP